jgi:hypothetical protein
MKVGGGLNIRAGKRIDVRVASLMYNYNPVVAGSRKQEALPVPSPTVTFTGRTAHTSPSASVLSFIEWSCPPTEISG